jgi:phenylacetaldehyde dehydrogenase
MDQAIIAEHEAALGAEARAFLAKQQRILIGGEFVDSVLGAKIPSLDPATGREIASVPACDVLDIDRAVTAARAALENPAWAKMRPADREKMLLRLADLIEAHADELAQIEVLDNGMTMFMARHVVVGSAIEFLRYMAGWATKIVGNTLDVSIPHAPHQEFVAYTVREPVGVVGAIIPWNVPLLMAIWKIAPALACGCTVVLKPAEETPLSALRLAELAVEAGVPPGVLNIVTGLGHVAGAALAAHPGVDKIAFTGSTEVGKTIGRTAIENMTRFSLELGGKSPVIVLEDADIQSVAPGAAMAIFMNSGQVCVAGSRLYVHKSKFDAVVADVSGIAASMKMGSGFDAQSQIGPLVSAKQQKRVSDYIASGVADGAKSIAPATCPDEGYFVAPTVMVDTNGAMKIVREEIFGPVLTAMPFSDIEEVVAHANDTVYGLGASIWSNDLSQVHRLTRRIKAGTIWVNTHSFVDPNMPFGGFKQSGIGREMGLSAIEQYTELKSICMLV